MPWEDEMRIPVGKEALYRSPSSPCEWAWRVFITGNQSEWRFTGYGKRSVLGVVDGSAERQLDFH